jgi:hypothetical protein
MVIVKRLLKFKVLDDAILMSLFLLEIIIDV